MTLASVFPFYKVLYEFIPVKFRGIVVVILLLWRLAAKNFMVRATRELEDFMPEIVAFTVDFFSALFVSVCMSSSGPINLAVFFIAADIGQSLLELHAVRSVSKSIRKLLQRHQRSQDQAKRGSDQIVGLSGPDLVSMILAVTRNPSAFTKKSMNSTRLWACLPHPVAREHTQRLNSLGASGACNWEISGPRINAGQPHSKARPQFHFGQSATIVPSPSQPLSGPTCAEISRIKTTQSETCKDSNVKDARTVSARQVVREGLRVLFHWEYVALVEYVECIVPLVFVAYKSVLEHLPNVVYYPGGAGSLSTAPMVNILIFGALEVGSFLLLNHFLQRKFAFSPLYQLAFVLETQMYSVQSKLFIETVLLLQYELAHLGTDFSFRFEWLKN